MKTRKKFALAVCMVLCLLMVAMTSISARVEAAKAPKQLTIGCIVPITNFPPGDSWARGYAMFADKLKEEGGLKIGKEQYQVKVIVEDSRASAEGAATAAKKLIYKDGAKFVFGEIWEHSAQAIYEVCASAPDKVLNVISWINIPGHAADVSPKKPLCVRFSVSLDESQVADYKWVLKNYPKVKTVVITGPDMGYDVLIKRNSPMIESLGVKIIGVELWPAELYQLAEFVPVCSKILTYKSDAVHIWMTGMAANQLRALRELGFKGPVIEDCPLGAEVVARIAGPEAATDVICNGADPTHPKDSMKEVMERWKAKYKEEYISDSLMAWDNLWVLMQVMQKAQSVEPEKVAAAVETMTKPGSLQTTFGPSYIGGMKRFGVNRVLVRPIPMVSIMKGITSVVGYYLPKE